MPDSSPPPHLAGMISSPAFWVPDKFVPSAWLEHAPFAFWVIEAHRPRVLVELGTHNGFSYLAFCQAVDRLGTGTRCYAVDHWKGDDHAGFYGEEVYDTLRSYHDPRYRGFSELLRLSFSDAARHFDDGTVDLLHIDGAHHLSDVTTDFDTWLPKMSDRGVIVFHDINVHRDDFGVYSLWEQVSRKYPHFAFDHGHGLGVLGVGDRAEETLGELFALHDSTDGNEVRAIFSRLGAGIADRARLLDESQFGGAEKNVQALRDAQALQRATAHRLAELVHHHSEAEQRAIRSEERFESTRAELQWAYGEIDALLTSKSWRVSAPLRLAMRIAKRIGRDARRGIKLLWWTVTLQLPRRLRAFRAYRSGDQGSPSTTMAAEAARFSAEGPLFEQQILRPPTRPPNARVIAFYLPQFHTIPENDEWWGTGFTEWRNTSRGLPRFAGHHQPRIPRDLGYYDLEDPTVMPRQIAMAKTAGIDAFCFYYYRFTEGRLLEKPVEDFLARPELDINFCLMWANENWTRTWDGYERDVLRGHDYSETLERHFLDDMLRHFADPRYVRIDGRPVLIVYRPGLIPDAAAAFARWRHRIESESGDRPILLMAQGFESEDPRPFGLDGAIEFPPHKLTTHLPEHRDEVHVLDPAFSGSVRSYEELVAAAEAEPTPDFPLVRTVTPSWDNESRRPGRGLTFAGSTPGAYGGWLRDSIRFARQNPLGSDPVVFVNAWNEWAEGAYLEPDVHHGYAYLNATRRATLSPIGDGSRRRILLVGHDAAAHGAQMLLLNIGRTMTRSFGVEIEFLLLDGGALLEEYEGVAPTRVMDPTDPQFGDLLHGLQTRGYSRAILNTVVSGGAVGRLSAAGFDTTVLIHEMASFVGDRGWEQPARACATFADRLVFADRFVADRLSQLIDLPEAKVVVAPQGIYQGLDIDETREEVRRTLDLPADTSLVLGVGYGDMRKGIDLFANAARLAWERGERLQFLWVGDIEPTVDRWLFGDALRPSNLSSIPFTDDVARYYAAADALFLSSREDAFPSTVLEALEFGMPVVGFADATGTGSLIAETGTVVPQFDLTTVVDALVKSVVPDTSAAQRRQAIARERFRFDDYAFGLLKMVFPAVEKISVVVTSFNYAGFLARRLATVFEQSYPVFEVIVLDDASTDDSLKVLAELATDRDFTVVGSDENSGSVFSQWAKAARIARGDLLWIAEADDESDPAFLERLMAVTTGLDPAPVLTFCDSRQIDGSGADLAPSYRYYFDKHAGDLFNDDFVMPGSEFAERCLTVRNLVLNASAALFQRTALAEVLDESLAELRGLRFAGDWIVYADLCRSGSVAFVAESLNVHRRHGGATLGATADAQIAEIARAHEMLNSRIPPTPEVLASQQAYLAELRQTLG